MDEDQIVDKVAEAIFITMFWAPSGITWKHVCTDPTFTALVQKCRRQARAAIDTYKAAISE